MKWRIIIRPRAEADLQAAQRWYEERREGLGAELVLTVRQAVSVLRENPDRRNSRFRRGWWSCLSRSNRYRTK